MKRYKVIDTSSFQRLNIRPGAVPSDGKLLRLPDPPARQQPIYGRFRPVPGRPDRIEVRDPQGRLPPFRGPGPDLRLRDSPFERVPVRDFTVVDFTPFPGDRVAPFYRV